MFRPRREDGETFLFGSPFENIDIDVPNAPTLHFEPTRFIQVDGVGSDQSGAIIVDDIFFSRPDDAKPGAKREPRPIGRRAHYTTTGQMRANRIVFATGFIPRISSGANFLETTWMRGRGHRRRVLLLRATKKQTGTSRNRRKSQENHGLEAPSIALRVPVASHKFTGSFIGR